MFITLPTDVLQTDSSKSNKSFPPIGWADSSLTAFATLDLIGTADVAKLIGVDRKHVTRVFEGKSSLRADLCPVVAGRRLIPRGYVPIVRAEIQRRRQESRKATGGTNAK